MIARGVILESTEDTRYRNADIKSMENGSSRTTLVPTSTSSSSSTLKKAKLSVVMAMLMNRVGFSYGDGSSDGDGNSRRDGDGDGDGKVLRIKVLSDLLKHVMMWFTLGIIDGDGNTFLSSSSCSSNAMNVRAQGVRESHIQHI